MIVFSCINHAFSEGVLNNAENYRYCRYHRSKDADDPFQRYGRFSGNLFSVPGPINL